MLILGVDTVAIPNPGEDGRKFRERVKQIYEEWFQRLAEKTECPSVGGWKLRKLWRCCPA